MPDIDTSRHPILVTTLATTWTLEDVDEFGRQLNELFEQRGPCYAITDVTRLRSSHAAQRARVSEVVDDLAARGAVLSEAIVVANPMIRGAITAYAWVRRKTNHPFRCFATVDQALEWTRSLQAANQKATTTADAR